METLRISYRGELRTEAVHTRSGSHLITDAPVDNQGKGEAYSPTDLLAAALGSCMMTIMGIAARTHGILLEGTQVRVTKNMAADPRRVKEVVVEFDFPQIGLSDKQKSILEHAARTCPVALSLHPELIQTVRFNFQ